MVKKYNILLKVFFLCAFIALGFTKINAQNTLIASEDFEGIQTVAYLNDTGVGANTGTNIWIVNNDYAGGAGYAPTISQDSTFGGLITFPNGNYLHIHDSIVLLNQGIGNANFNPANPSDKFTKLGSFCTLGYSAVTFAFYFMCEGDSNNAYGELYYRANNGPWLLLNNQYHNTYKWKYENITNPAFDGVSNLEFGFRWINNSSNITPNASFAIDDIRLVGTFDQSATGISMDTMMMVPVCQGNNMILYFNLAQPLCGTGFYEVQLSNSTGSFANPTSLGIYQLNNQITYQGLFLSIPGNTPAGTCYQIRIARIDLTPAVFSDTTICFEVLFCPNTITTLGPAVLSVPTDTVCVWSVIDVPFYSTGIFVNNTYVAQLSDSAGNFPPNPNVLGTFPNSQTYDPALGSLPGSVSGLIQPLFHPIPPGCNYYIRIISINPAATGTLYGPFCIRECDIVTNNMQDVQACITSTTGYDTLIEVDINYFDSVAIYDTSNFFQIQILDNQTFQVVNTAVLGQVQAVNDTTIHLVIPALPGLAPIGMQPKMYYMRVIATNSSTPWNNLGTVVHLTIGAPYDQPLTVVAYNPFNFTGYISFQDSSVCEGDAIYFTMQPYNPNSQYVWTLNQNTNWSTDPFNGILFNAAGNYTYSLIETNNGCVGPGSDTVHITTLGPPLASISGPLQICQGDTGHYQVPLQPNSYYTWGSNNGVIIDTLNNVLNLYFPNSGTTQVTIQALNFCGSANSFRNVMVRPLPTVDAGSDTTVCPFTEVNLHTTSGPNYSYLWTQNGQNVGNSAQLSLIPDTSGYYVIETTSWPGLNCKRMDSVYVQLLNPGTTSTTDTTICDGDLWQMNAGPGVSYSWSTGSTDQIVETGVAGDYVVWVYVTAGTCASIDTFSLATVVCEEPVADSIFVPNVFTRDGDNINSKFMIYNVNYKSIEVTVFNRWGLKVGYWNGLTDGWDGTNINNGQVCSDGVYFYIGKAVKKDGIVEDLHGTVTLISK